MLVFTRKVGESLVIGDSIEVKLLSVSGEHVRVGIEAPREVPIHRNEVYRLIVRQNRRASNAAGPGLEALSEHLTRSSTGKGRSPGKD